MSPARARSSRRRVVAVLAVLVLAPVLAAGAFLAGTNPPVAGFDPQPWSPGPGAAAAGVPARPLVPSTAASAPLPGPEDIAVDGAGRVYTGGRDAIVWRIGPDGVTIPFADVGGRPLGMMFDGRGHLVVANHGVGLQRVAPDGTVSLIASEAAGSPIRFANDIDIAADGTVYLTDSSSRYNTASLGADATSYLFPDLLDGRAAGRVIAVAPTGATEVLLDGLHFPNGVALTAGGTRLWIAESNRFRVLEYRLADRAVRVLVDDLPGIPDNINRDADGSMLVALYDRVVALDTLVLPFALARQIAIRLPQRLFVDDADPPSGGVLVLDGAGAVRRHLTGLTPAATAVVPAGGRWYLGALLPAPVRWTSPAR